MIACVFGRCLTESCIASGLRLNCHPCEARSSDHRCAEVFSRYAEGTGLWRRTPLFSRKLSIRCPCSRRELEAWKSYSWRSVLGTSGQFLLRAALAIVDKSTKPFGLRREIENDLLLNCKPGIAFENSSISAQRSVTGEKSNPLRYIFRARGGKTAMETRNGSNAEIVEMENSAIVRGASPAPLPGIICPPMTTVGKSTNIVWQECMVKRNERQKLLGQKGCVVWITGLSGSGKSTLACTLDHALLSRGNLSYVLDGDNVRHGLNNNLGFCAEDRVENIRRIGEVAKLFVDAGVICIASVISPYRKERDACRQLLRPGEFIEVFMNFPLKICENRDPKGLYKLARAGKIKGFTGVDDPYEAPLNCEVVMEPINGKCPAPAEMAAHLISYLEHRGFLEL